MSKLTKVLLVLSLSCLIAGLVFATGLVDVGEVVALYTILPAGAIFFGLFLISLTLQAETASFDEEQRKISAAPGSAKTVSAKPCCQADAGKQTLAGAHAH